MRLWRPLQRPWTWNQPRPFRCVHLDVSTCTCKCLSGLSSSYCTDQMTWVTACDRYHHEMGKNKAVKQWQSIKWMLVSCYPVHVCAVGLCVWLCRFMCTYKCIMWPKKLVVWGLTAQKSFFGAIYCSLIKFNHQKRSLLCQLGKEIWRLSINGMRKGFPENCITISHASSTCNAATCSYAMLLRL